MTKSNDSERGPILTVVAHSEQAGGDLFRYHAGPWTPVETIMKQLYRKLGTERKNDDRLACVGVGASFFPHETEQLGRLRRGVHGGAQIGDRAPGRARGPQHRRHDRSAQLPQPRALSAARLTAKEDTER